MLRIIRYGLAAAAALLVTVLVAVLTLPLWLVPGLAVLLPPGWALDEVQVEPEPPRLPTLRRLALFASGCRLLSLDEGRAVVAWQGAMPTLDALHLDALTIDPACLAGRTEPASAVVDLPGWVGTLFAGTRLQVDRLVIAGWLPQPHRLELGVSAAAVEARVEGPALQLAGRWDAGAGITVHELQMGQAQLATAALTVLRPRLVLDGPARLDIATGRVTATAHLSADRLNLTAGGKLEQPAVTVRLAGPPNNLGWTAEGAAAGGIGPLRGTGIWSGETLSGRLALARQALTALRPLLPPTLPVELQAGQADVEVVVTWSRDAPSQVRLGGELNVSQPPSIFEYRHWEFQHLVDPLRLIEQFALAHAAAQPKGRTVVARIDQDAVVRERPDGVAVEAEAAGTEGYRLRGACLLQTFRSLCYQLRLFRQVELMEELSLAADARKQGDPGLVNPLCVQVKVCFMSRLLHESDDLGQRAYPEASGEERFDEADGLQPVVAEHTQLEGKAEFS